MDEERLLSPDADESDKSLEKSLRPRYLAQYIGQDKVKQELSIYIEAAKNRQEALDHVLLYGPPGLGKTTMAMVIANEMDVQIRSTSGPAIERPGDLVAILNELEPGDVLFIDEIHRLPRVAEETLYSAPFTLVGATTRAGMLSAPLRDRFGIISHMEYYEEDDLREIVLRSADIFQTEIVGEGAVEIARRSRGTPRIANRLLKRIRDFAQVQSDGVINQTIADQALGLLQVDEAGLDYIDQKLLKTMIELYHGGPIGLSTLAVNIGEERETVEDMYEPYLIQKGFIKRTPRGRMATPLAYEHFNYPYQE
jgi:Holliday junction DNA helicase RuvB